MLTKRKLRGWVSLFLSRMPSMPGKGQLIYALNRWLLPRAESECVVETEMHLGYRMMVDLRTLTEAQVAYTHDYDTQEIRSCLRLLPADSVILDVGANIGFWTVPMALMLNAEGQIHAFEPLPGNCNRLRENVTLNGIEHFVHIHEMGLSDEPATLEISLREDFARGSQTGNAAIVIDETDRQFRCTTIAVDTLDDIFDSLHVTRLDFVKIDIEGHEDRFLAGAGSVISRFRPIIFVEINEHYYQRRGIDVDERFQSWLSSFNYVCAFPTSQGWNLREFRSRTPVLDDVLFVPSERLAELLPRLSRQGHPLHLCSNHSRNTIGRRSLPDGEKQ
jgi:FkbM family methyltransferase